MNMKLNKTIISKKYQELLSFANSQEKLDHDAQMISYKILSEVEKICNEKRINKKDLAEKIGSSKSYITQLFTGVKSVNIQTMAKFESALEASFEIILKQNVEYCSESLPGQIIAQTPAKYFIIPKDSWYNCDTEIASEIEGSTETKHKLKQVA